MLQSKNLLVQLGLVLALVALLSGAVIQAQTLEPPVILRVKTDIAGEAVVMWDPVLGASRYEVYVRSFNNEWKPSKRGGKGGWYPADGDSWHQIKALKPGAWYNYRVRAIDADGQASKPSKLFKSALAPCWAWQRYWATEVKWTEAHTADPFTPPKEWEGIENIGDCRQ